MCGLPTVVYCIVQGIYIYIYIYIYILLKLLGKLNAYKTEGLLPMNIDRHIQKDLNSRHGVLCALICVVTRARRCHVHLSLIRYIKIYYIFINWGF